MRGLLKDRVIKNVHRALANAVNQTDGVADATGIKYSATRMVVHTIPVLFVVAQGIAPNATDKKLFKYKSMMELIEHWVFKSEMRCQTCRGKGECRICDGYGYSKINNRLRGGREKNQCSCPKGRCPTCDGKGVVSVQHQSSTIH